MMKKCDISFIILLLFLEVNLLSCTQTVEIPVSAEETNESAEIFPDYSGVVIPYNIAPLNFMVKNAGENYVCVIEGKNGSPLIEGAKADGKFDFELEKWKTLLALNKRGELRFTIYSNTENGWKKHPSFSILVAEEEIDSFVSYRLIEPGYELYHQMGIYQRDLTNFDESVIYENNFDGSDSHCINCHSYQNYGSNNLLFHVRGAHGGTVIVQGGKADKRIMTTEHTLGNAVYPSWHPEKPWLVFSSNMTSQSFHMRDMQKVEVVDHASDLLFYDAGKNEISNILKTNADLENFPCWSPDGKKIYYCKATVPALDSLDVKETNKRQRIIMDNYDHIYYDLMSLPFNEEASSWGDPEIEVACSEDSLSASVPRVSPDGRYVLFTLAQFGQFHIWHKSSDLYIKDLQTGVIRPLANANSDEADSYHGWSSNGRWIVFATRRDDGNYSHLYIAYFDRRGKEHKAFLLPQKDPESNMIRLKSYNVPEFTKDKVSVESSVLKDVIFQDEKSVKVNYK